jgi:DNA processing protein
LSDLLPRVRVASTQPQLTFDPADAPRATREPVIWCAGNTGLLTGGPTIAIVGTRNASMDGAARARRLGKELAERRLVVVSGLARGIDTEALTAAIEAGGAVIGVIGTPIDRAYPIQNARLQESIARSHLLISPFRPGTKTLPRNFPARNRLMAAISDATAIIEAGDDSGTLHQADECVRLGRWLFIAKTVTEDRSVTWPARFAHARYVRTLSHTEDILKALSL